MKFPRALLYGFALLVAGLAYYIGFSAFINKVFDNSKEERAIETLVAPFAADPDASLSGPIPQLPSDSLNVAHRAVRDVGIWAVTAISDSLSFQSDNVQEELKTKAKAFDNEGYKQYTAFLSESGFLQAPDGSTTHIQSFVPQEPVLLNEGVANNRYRWLFEIPLMATYQPKGMTGYKNQSPQTRNFMIRVQVGRVDNTADEYGLAIESWSARLVRDKK